MMPPRPHGPLRKFACVAGAPLAIRAIRGAVHALQLRSRWSARNRSQAVIACAAPGTQRTPTASTQRALRAMRSHALLSAVRGAECVTTQPREERGVTIPSIPRLKNKRLFSRSSARTGPPYKPRQRTVHALDPLAHLHPPLPPATPRLTPSRAARSHFTMMLSAALAVALAAGPVRCPPAQSSIPLCCCLLLRVCAKARPARARDSRRALNTYTFLVRTRDTPVASGAQP